MAIKALNLDAEWDFTSENDPDKGKEDATVWTLRTLSNRVLAYLQDRATSFSGDDEKNVEARIMTNTMAIDIVRYGLVGVKNFSDEDGKEVAFSTTKKDIQGRKVTAVPYSFLEVIPKAVIMEMATELQKGNELDEEDVKN